jgi:hypothetical protein
LLGINNNFEIAGYHGASVNKGFTLVLPNAFTSENYPASAQTQVIGINTATSKTVGFYIDGKGRVHGFQAVGGHYASVDFPVEPFNQLLGQNNVGQAAGYYSTRADGTGPDTPYIYDEFGGVFEVLVIPHSASAQATGINDAGNICGFTIDSSSVSHGFVLLGGNLTILNSSTGTQALGLNNQGLVGRILHRQRGRHARIRLELEDEFLPNRGRSAWYRHNRRQRNQ